MKKKAAILILSMFFVFSAFIQPQQKAQAVFPLAIPAGSGAVALGAIALGGLLVGVGMTEYGEEISTFGSNVWNKTTTATKDAVNAVTSWVDNNYAVPDLKIDYGALSADVKNTLLNDASYTGSQGFAGSAQTDYSGTAATVQFPNNTALSTQFPSVDWTITTSWPMTSYIDNADPNYTFVVYDTVHKEAYFSDHLTLKDKEFRFWRYYKLSVPLSYVDGETYFQFSSMTVDSTWWNSVKGTDITFEQVFSTFKSQLDSRGVAISYVPTAVAENIKNNAYFSHYSEAWESMKDAGLVIDGQAILEANPNVVWDAEQGAFADATTGTAVDTGTLALPKLGVQDGVIGYPVGDTWVDVKTGEGVGTDTPPADGDTVGDKNINWGKLKMIGDIFTTKFPFSLPWDVGRALTAVFGQFDEHNIPSWTWNINFFGTIYPVTFTIPEMLANWFPITRTLILIGFDIALVFSVRKLLGGAS